MKDMGKFESLSEKPKIETPEELRDVFKKVQSAIILGVSSDRKPTGMLTNQIGYTDIKENLQAMFDALSNQPDVFQHSDYTRRVVHGLISMINNGDIFDSEHLSLAKKIAVRYYSPDLKIRANNVDELYDLLMEELEKEKEISKVKKNLERVYLNHVEKTEREKLEKRETNLDDMPEISTHQAILEEFFSEGKEILDPNLLQAFIDLILNFSVSKTDSFVTLLANEDGGKRQEFFTYIMNKICQDDLREFGLISTLVFNVTQKLVGYTTVMAFDKFGAYKKSGTGDYPKWSRDEVAKAQFGLAMLHIQERLFGDMTFSLPKLDGIFLAVDPNSEDERFLQLETTWYIYATEVYRVVPTVFDMLNQLQEDPELLPREMKKRAIYDFCTVYHPIRGLGYSMSSRVPPSLLHYYFSSIVTRINHGDRLIRVGKDPKTGEEVHMTATEYSRCLEGVLLDSLMMLQEQQKMMLISLKSVEYEEAKSLVGNLQGVKENQQECLNLLKDVADEKSENWSTIHGKYSDFRNKAILGKLSVKDQEADRSYFSADEAFKKLGAQAGELDLTNKNLVDAMYDLYTTQFAIGELTNDEDTKLESAYGLACLGSAYLQKTKSVVSYVSRFQLPLKGKELVIYAVYHQEYTLLFEDNGRDNQYVREYMSQMPSTGEISPATGLSHNMSLNPQNGYDNGLYTALFDESPQQDVLHNYKFIPVTITTSDGTKKTYPAEVSSLYKKYGLTSLDDLKYRLGFDMKSDVIITVVPGSSGSLDRYYMKDEAKQKLGLRSSYRYGNVPSGKVRESGGMYVDKDGKPVKRSPIMEGDKILVLDDLSCFKVTVPVKAKKGNTYHVSSVLDDEMFQRQGRGKVKEQFRFNASYREKVESPDRVHVPPVGRAITSTSSQKELHEDNQELKESAILQHPAVIQCQHIAHEMRQYFDLLLSIQPGASVTPSIQSDLSVKKEQLKNYTYEIGILLNDPVFKKQVDDLRNIKDILGSDLAHSDLEEDILVLVQTVDYVSEFFKPHGRAWALTEGNTAYLRNDFETWFATEGAILLVVILVSIGTMGLSAGLLPGVAGLLLSSSFSALAGVGAQEVATLAQTHWLNDTDAGRKLLGIYGTDAKFISYSGFAQYLTNLNGMNASQRAAGFNTMLTGYIKNYFSQVGMNLFVFGFGKYFSKPFMAKYSGVFKKWNDLLQSGSHKAKLFLSKVTTNSVILQKIQGGVLNSIYSNTRYTIREILEYGNVGELKSELLEETVYEQIAEQLFGPYGQLLVGSLGSFDANSSIATQVPGQDPFEAFGITYAENQENLGEITAYYDAMSFTNFTTHLQTQQNTEIITSDNGEIRLRSSSGGEIVFLPSDLPSDLRVILSDLQLSSEFVQNQSDQTVYGTSRIEGETIYVREELLPILEEKLLVGPFTFVEENGQYTIVGPDGVYVLTLLTEQEVENEEDPQTDVAEAVQDYENELPGGSGRDWNQVGNNMSDVFTPPDVRRTLAQTILLEMGIDRTGWDETMILQVEQAVLESHSSHNTYDDYAHDESGNIEFVNRANGIPRYTISALRNKISIVLNSLLAIGISFEIGLRAASLLIENGILGERLSPPLSEAEIQEIDSYIQNNDIQQLPVVNSRDTSTEYSLVLSTGRTVTIKSLRNPEGVPIILERFHAQQEAGLPTHNWLHGFAQHGIVVEPHYEFSATMGDNISPHDPGFWLSAQGGFSGPHHEQLIMDMGGILNQINGLDGDNFLYYKNFNSFFVTIDPETGEPHLLLGQNDGEVSDDPQREQSFEDTSKGVYFWGFNPLISGDTRIPSMELVDIGEYRFTCDIESLSFLFQENLPSVSFENAKKIVPQLTRLDFVYARALQNSARNGIPERPTLEERIALGSSIILHQQCLGYNFTVQEEPAKEAKDFLLTNGITVTEDIYSVDLIIKYANLIEDPDLTYEFLLIILGDAGVVLMVANILIDSGICQSNREIDTESFFQDGLFETIFTIEGSSPGEVAMFVVSMQEVLNEIVTKGYNVIFLPERGAGPMGIVLNQLIQEQGITGIDFISIPTGNQQFINANGQRMYRRHVNDIYQEYTQKYLTEHKNPGDAVKICILDEVNTGGNMLQLGNTIVNGCNTGAQASGFGEVEIGFIGCRDVSMANMGLQYSTENDEEWAAKFYTEAVANGNYSMIATALFFQDRDFYLNYLNPLYYNGQQPTSYPLVVRNNEAHQFFTFIGNDEYVTQAIAYLEQVAHNPEVEPDQNHEGAIYVAAKLNAYLQRITYLQDRGEWLNDQVLFANMSVQGVAIEMLNWIKNFYEKKQGGHEARSEEDLYRAQIGSRYTSNVWREMTDRGSNISEKKLKTGETSNPLDIAEQLYGAVRNGKYTDFYAWSPSLAKGGRICSDDISLERNSWAFNKFMFDATYQSRVPNYIIVQGIKKNGSREFFIISMDEIVEPPTVTPVYTVEKANESQEEAFEGTLRDVVEEQEWYGTLAIIRTRIEKKQISNEESELYEIFGIKTGGNQGTIDNVQVRFPVSMNRLGEFIGEYGLTGLEPGREDLPLTEHHINAIYAYRGNNMIANSGDPEVMSSLITKGKNIIYEVNPTFFLKPRAIKNANTFLESRGILLSPELTDLDSVFIATRNMDKEIALLVLHQVFGGNQRTDSWAPALLVGLGICGVGTNFSIEIQQRYLEKMIEIPIDLENVGDQEIFAQSIKNTKGRTGDVQITYYDQQKVSSHDIELASTIMRDFTAYLGYNSFRVQGFPIIARNPLFNGSYTTEDGIMVNCVVKHYVPGDPILNRHLESIQRMWNQFCEMRSINPIPLLTNENFVSFSGGIEIVGIGDNLSTSLSSLKKEGERNIYLVGYNIVSPEDLAVAGKLFNQYDNIKQEASGKPDWKKELQSYRTQLKALMKSPGFEWYCKKYGLENIPDLERHMYLIGPRPQPEALTSRWINTDVKQQSAIIMNLFTKKYLSDLKWYQNKDDYEIAVLSMNYILKNPMFEGVFLGSYFVSGADVEWFVGELLQFSNSELLGGVQNLSEYSQVSWNMYERTLPDGTSYYGNLPLLTDMAADDAELFVYGEEMGSIHEHFTGNLVSEQSSEGMQRGVIGKGTGLMGNIFTKELVTDYDYTESITLNGEREQVGEQLAQGIREYILSVEGDTDLIVGGLRIGKSIQNVDNWSIAEIEAGEKQIGNRLVKLSEAFEYPGHCVISFIANQDGRLIELNKSVYFRFETEGEIYYETYENSDVNAVFSSRNQALDNSRPPFEYLSDLFMFQRSIGAVMKNYWVLDSSGNPKSQDYSRGNALKCLKRIYLREKLNYDSRDMQAIENFLDTHTYVQVETISSQVQLISSIYTNDAELDTDEIDAIENRITNNPGWGELPSSVRTSVTQYFALVRSPATSPIILERLSNDIKKSIRTFLNRNIVEDMKVDPGILLIFDDIKLNIGETE